MHQQADERTVGGRTSMAFDPAAFPGPRWRGTSAAPDEGGKERSRGRFAARVREGILRRAGWLGMLVVFLGWPVSGRAAEPGTNAALVSLVATNDRLTAEYLNRQLAALSNRTDLTPAVRTNALAVSLEAEQRLAEARRQAEETVRLHQETTNAPVLIADLQALLARPAAPGGVGISTNATLVELEQALSRTEADLAQATKDQDGLAQEPSRRTARLAELTRLIGETAATRERLTQELRAAPRTDAEPELRQANHDLARARLQYREAELARYEEEQANLNATADVVRLRSDVARRRVAALTQEREALVATVNRRREQESLQASLRAAEATRRAEALNEPWILQLAQTNSALAKERSRLAERLKDASTRLDLVTSNRLALRQAFQSVRDRVDVAERAGLSRNFAIGLLLRRQQLALRGQGDARDQARQQSGAISEAQIAQFAAVDARRAIEPVDDTAAAMVARWVAAGDAGRASRLLDEAKSLLVAQRESLGGLVRDYDAYLAMLFRFQAALEESAGVVDEFRGYLAHRVLWIRSTEPIHWAGLAREAAAVMGSLRSPRWARTVEVVWEDLRRSWPSGVACLAGVVLLHALRGRFHGRLLEASALARHGRNTSIQPTLRAVLYTSLRVVPLPLFILVLGWGCWSATNAREEANQTLGPALMMLAAILFVLSFLREICLPDGLASAHFRVPEADVALLNRALTWSLWGLPWLGFLNRLLESEFAEGLSNRLAFLPTVAACAVLGHVLFRPRGGLGSGRKASGSAARSGRLWRRLAHGGAVLIPVLCGVASAMGYNYSARHLWLRFLASIFVALGLQLIGAVLFRWIYLTRRRLAMEHALKPKPHAGDASEAPAELPMTEDSTQAELLASMGQARRILNWTYGLALACSLYGIWSGTLPALQALDRIPVWARSGTMESSPARAPSSVPLAGEVSVNASSATTSAGEVAEAAGAARFVSVWDLLLVILTVAVVTTAAANLPGFLEMAVFSHAKLDRGTGYAITTTLRYAIILVGVVLTAQGLGLQWSQVQWLAAAVTLGIGFGLQEIFANFVSGLILLLERPVRIGDVVTVGEVSGTVTRIQIRATTIRDADNRELVLPNKELITGRFVNWTLSDSVTRIVCGVGIAYESDIRRAQGLLLDLARQNPAVLSDPAPAVTFDSFGESTLNLSLRVHVARPDQRLSTLSELNAGILEAFREAKIEIAYPQRDLNVRLLASDLPPALVQPKG